MGISLSTCRKAGLGSVRDECLFFKEVAFFLGGVRGERAPGSPPWNSSLPGETRVSLECRNHALLGRQFHQHVLWEEWILLVMGVVLTPAWWPFLSLIS